MDTRRHDTFDWIREKAKKCLSKQSNKYTLIPACPENIEEPRFPLSGNSDENYNWYWQPFRQHRLQASFELGRELDSLGRLGPILLSEIIKPCASIDFKAYCCNISHDNESCILSRQDILLNNTNAIENVIKTWMKMCNLSQSVRNKTLRRCVVIDFITDFIMDGEDTQHRSGHCITLCLELRHKILHLKIYDYRMHEYIHNVHDQLFQWMIEAAEQFRDHFNSIHTEVVCLKGKLHVDGAFMTCMSAAYRVCIYLSKSNHACINESEEEFIMDSYNLQEHIFRMYEWANKKLIGNVNALLISPEMSEIVYEIKKENCYLMLVPYNNPRDNISLVDMRKVAKRVTYSIVNGFSIAQDVG